jgi:1-acyl-sn-glycerol-3-phosphate acyltransferase
VSALAIRTWFRVRIEGLERLPPGPALYCFNHLSWMDPLIMLATFPSQPRLHFFGPKQADLRKGRRNRFIRWTTIPVPFSPLKDDLLTSIRRAQAVLDSGANLAISGEGSIHVHEGELLRLQEGTAYIALRARVPIVPVAISGSSWAHFRGRLVVRIGEPIRTEGRPTRGRIAAYTAQTWHALHQMLANDRNLPVPKWRIELWVTDLFNDWDGGRETAELIHGPGPDEVPFPSPPAV